MNTLPKLGKKKDLVVWSTRITPEAKLEITRLKSIGVDVPKILQKCLYSCLDKIKKESV